jgi:hypothetical protein
MASTSSKNTPGDYQLEQWSHTQHVNYNTYAQYGRPVNTYLPGDGLLGGNVHRENFAQNSCDIESMLRGIGSTNLVSPQEPVKGQLYSLKSLSVIDRIPLLVPAPLKVEPNQRPLRE